jgi:hypothetical protein
MYIIPTMPHLKGLELSVTYRELPDNEAQLMSWHNPQKWKNDPSLDRFYGFAPRNKYYVNGEVVRESRPGLSAVSRTPFPEKRVPRRGLTAVPSDDPDYARICREQGLEHLIPMESSSQGLPNGFHASPRPGVAAHPSTNGSTRTHQSFANGDGPPLDLAAHRTPFAAPIINGKLGNKDAAVPS